jgi:hypothetical protein
MKQWGRYQKICIKNLSVLAMLKKKIANKKEVDASA